MRVLQGRSFATQASEAVHEATADWDAEVALDFLLVFCSMEQDIDEVAAEVEARWPGVPTVGCTTSGEHLAGEHSNKSLVMMGLQTPEIQWATTCLKDLAKVDAESAEAAVDGLFSALGAERDTLEPGEYFSMLFIDGLRMREEVVASLLADALEGVQLVGGSAGDDLAFTQTSVLHCGKAHTDAAVVVMGHSSVPFSIIKHQHFTTTPRTLVITRADPAARRVYEIDGYPALEAYAAALGMDPKDVDGDVSFLNPITFTSNHEIYVRSVQSIGEDGSMVFYCAVEEGMVLDVGGHHDMEEMLEKDLDRIRGELGTAEVLVAFNCILRALEATGSGQHEGLGALLKRAAKHSVGFDTYGEQLNGLHINQTLVALAFGQAA